MAVSKYTPQGAFRYTTQPTVKDLPFQPWLAAAEMDYKKAQDTDKALSDATLSIDAIYGDVDVAAGITEGYNKELDNITEQYHLGQLSHQQANRATAELQRKHMDALAGKAILEERKKQELAHEADLEKKYEDTPQVATYMKALQRQQFNKTPRGKDTPIQQVNAPRALNSDDIIEQQKNVLSMVKETLIQQGKYTPTDLDNIHTLYDLVDYTGRTGNDIKDIVEAHMSSPEVLNSFRIQAESDAYLQLKSMTDENGQPLYTEEKAIDLAKARGAYETNYREDVPLLDKNGEPVYDENGNPKTQSMVLPGTGMYRLLESAGTLGWTNIDRDKFTTKDPIAELEAGWELEHAMGNIDIVNNAVQEIASTGYNADGVANEAKKITEQLDALFKLEEAMKTEGKLTPGKQKEIDDKIRDLRITQDLIKQRQTEAENYAAPQQQELVKVQEQVGTKINTILADAASSLSEGDLKYIKSKDWTNYHTVGRPHQDPAYLKLSSTGKQIMQKLQEATAPLQIAEQKYKTALNTYYEDHSKDIADIWVGTDMPGAIGKLATKKKIMLQEQIAKAGWTHLHSHNPNSKLFGTDQSIDQQLGPGGKYDGWKLKVTSANGIGFSKTPIDNLGNHAFIVPVTIEEPDSGKTYTDNLWLRTDQINNDDVKAILNSPEHKANMIWERGRRQGLERYTPYEFPNMTFVYGDRSTHTDDRVLIKVGNETYNYSVEEVFGANYVKDDKGETKELPSLIIDALSKIK